MNKRYFRLVVLLTALFAQPVARADESSAKTSSVHLTARGRFLVAGQISGGYSDDSRTGWGSYNRWWVSIHPSLTYFLRDRMGLGIWAGGGIGESKFKDRVTDYGFGVKALFDIPLGPSVSLFIGPSVGFEHESATQTAPQLVPLGVLRVRTKRSFVPFRVDLPLVYHCSDSVAIGFGPQLRVDYFVKQSTDVDSITGASMNTSSTSKTRLITGLMSFIGGSF